VTVAEDDPVRVDGLVGRRKEGRHDGLQVFGSTRESIIFESSEKKFGLHHYWRNLLVYWKQITGFTIELILNKIFRCLLYFFSSFDKY
jgi:hypothetical protein